MRLDGKVAIVTGGGKGIGRVYVEGLAREGAKVVAADIDEDAAVKTQDALVREGREVIAIKTDVASEQSIKAMVDETVKRFGRIDVLVNNAALFTALAQHGWEEITVEEWDQVMAVNVRGVFLCCRAVAYPMKTQGGGSIINISSTVFWAGGSRPHYGTSKAAVIGITRAMARNLGQYKIRVNSIAPGLTTSDTLLAVSAARGADRMSLSHSRAVTDRCLQQEEDPEDLVGTVVFLASDDSAFTTGQTFVVDGGQIFD